MNKVDKILNFAKRGIPQALARFNDGETGIIFNKNFVAARGDQKGSIELQVSLIDSIKHEQDRYWKGYPCPVCMKKWRDKLGSAGYINLNYEWNTLAVVNTNRNLRRFHTELPEVLKKKKVIWVSGDDQDLNKLDFDIVYHVDFSNKNSWNYYELIYDECIHICRPGMIFLFSCGPTARVLVKNLYQVRPDATFLDIGSTYDPFTRDVWHKCHTGKLKGCSGCN